MTLYVFKCRDAASLFVITREESGRNIGDIRRCSSWEPYLTIGPTMSLQQLTGRDPNVILADIERRGYCIVDAIYEWS